ncbi:MAG: winged helix-turn-helix transcriptional regulator [Gemmatimonadaceae bacterium]|nr:winged helix-turn-helix transcriptional regulator [Gemmatimonadaceae bacterium]
MSDARHPPLTATSAAGGSPARVADTLHRSAIQLLRRLRQEDRRSGLSGPRASALSVLVFGGPMTLGALAAAEQVRPPTMSRLVSAMESEGLLLREGDANDARVVRVRATAKGIRILQAARARRLARLQVALESLPPGELDTLDDAAALLERVARTL